MPFCEIKENIQKPNPEPGNPLAKKQPQCAFCHMKRPDCGDILEDGNLRYHECCALYSPLVYTKNERLVNVKSEIKRGNRLKCTVCNKPGASIGCSVKSCKKTFHFPCAKDANAYVSSDFALRCEAHAKQLIAKAKPGATVDFVSLQAPKQDAEPMETDGANKGSLRALGKPVVDRPDAKCAFCKMDHPGCGPLLESEGDGDLKPVIYHECCAEYSPLVHELDGKVVNIEKEARRGRLLKCVVCGDPGASIGCTVKSCKKTFHFPCAGDAMCYVSGYNLRCETHAREHLRTRFKRLCRSEEFQEHAVLVQDILLRKADELVAARGEDENSGDTKEKSEGAMANDKSRMSRIMKRLEGDMGWKMNNDLKEMPQRARRASTPTPKPEDQPKNPSKKRCKEETEPDPPAKRTKTTENPAQETPDKNTETQPSLPAIPAIPPGPPIPVGSFVDVVERQVPGQFKEGGRARILKVNSDGTYNVKMIVGGGVDKNVPAWYVRPVDKTAMDEDKEEPKRRGRKVDPDYNVGEKVLVKWTRRYYAGFIDEKLTQGKYKVRFVGSSSRNDVHYSKIIDIYSQHLVNQIRTQNPSAVIVLEKPKKQSSSSKPKKSEHREKIKSDWRRKITVGDKVEALDTQGRWLPAEIIEATKTDVKVHYIGYGAKYNESMPRVSTRLRIDDAQISFHVVRREEGAELWKIEALAALENIFRWQLPAMPREYITKLLYDPDHRTMCLMKAKSPDEKKKVIGGITYKPFWDLAFAEVVFCAVIGHEQVRGCGSQLMNHLKEHLGKEGITHFITYADDGALGFFQKQGYTKELSLPKEKWDKRIVEYKGGQLMDCKLDPKGVSRLYHGLGDDQNVSGGVYPIGARVEVQFLDEAKKESESGKKWFPAKILLSVEENNKVKYKVHYIGWNAKWDQWTVPEHIRPDLNYNQKRR
mmetsp:Transcript_7037/g.13139  ORF Transcript_7037/g.13139 Transcript_7037/m.13139 type:complete len:931 (-) Transcript_7037:100-2892(-)